MKNSILAVSGTLWAFSLLIGQSFSLHQVTNDDLDDGATLAERSSRLDLSHDMSDPVLERFARGVDDQDKYTSPSPKFNHLILIVPCVLGVAIIVLIVVVICCQLRKSGRNSCISNEWLIWCGLIKREYSSPTPGAAHNRPSYHPEAASSRYPGGGESASTFLQHSQEIRTSEWVKVAEFDASPSEKSPLSGDTPTTDVLSLSTDNEDVSPQTVSLVHHREIKPNAKKFIYPNPPLETGGTIAIGQTNSVHGHYLDNIQENGNVDDKNGNRGKNWCSVKNGGGEISGIRNSNITSSSDDDVFESDENDNLVTYEDAGAGKEIQRGKSGMRRGRVDASGGSSHEGPRTYHSKGVSELNTPNTNELEAAVTKVQQPPIMANPLQSGESPSPPPSQKKQQGQRVDRVEESQRKEESAQENICSNGSHFGEINPDCPPKTVPPSDRKFLLSECKTLYVQVISGDAKLDIGAVKEMQIGDKKIDTHHHFTQLPIGSDRDPHSQAFNRNSKGRQTR